jgi:hypothetical protein
MKYFLHDSNSFNDEKITLLFMNFGYEGLGLFYTILEKLASQEKPIKTEVLKKQLFVGKKLEKCWNFMESLEIISSNNGETFNKQLLNYAETYTIKKEKTAKRISQWRENEELKKNVTHYKSVRNAPKVKVSKVNRSKDIINIDTNVSIKGEVDFIFEEFWRVYKKGTKVISLQKFKKLTKDEMFAIKQHLPLYLANHEQNRKMDFLPYFQTYINQKRWLDPLPYQNNNQDW